MQKSSRGRRLVASTVLLSYLLLGAAGCGSSNQDFSSANPGGPVPVQRSQYVLGRVMFENRTAGQRVEIQDLSGRVLFKFTTRPGGWFMGPGTLPDDFNVVAFQGQDMYRLENRGGWTRGTLYVTPGTALASAYKARHPELASVEAEARVKKYLGLPNDYDLKWIGNVGSPELDLPRFYGDLAQAGSIAALSEQVDRQVAFSVADDALKLASATGSAIYGAAVTDATGDAVANMGFNFTTAGALNNIEGQLSDVTTELNVIQGELNKFATYATLSATLQPLNDASATINETIVSIQDQVSAYLSSHADTTYNVPIAGTGSPSNSQLSATASKLDGLVQTLAGGLTDTSSGNVVNQYSQTQLSSFKFPNASHFRSYPWRRNATTEEIEQLVGKYTSALGQAAELFSEIGHVASPDQRADKIALAVQQGADASSAIQYANMLVPDRLGADTVMLDIDAKLLWYSEFMPAEKSTNSNIQKNIIENLTVGPYSGFRLASYSELDNLLRTRVGPQITGTTINSTVSHWDDVSTASWTNAFSALGFNTTNYGNVDDPGEIGAGDNEGSWVSDQFTYAGGGTETGQYYLTWNNDGKNPDEDGWGSSATSSYLLCAAYPTTDDNVVQTSDDPDLIALNETSQQTPWSIPYISDEGSIQSSSTTDFGVQLKATKFFDSPLKAGGRYGAGSWDITNRVQWSSSNTALATVSNLAQTTLPFSSATQVPGPAGFVTWHPPAFPNDPPLAPVTISYTLLGFEGDGSTKINTVPITLNPPAGLKAVVNEVNFLPRNTQYSLLNGSQLISFYVTSFFVDGKIVDVSGDPNTRWTLKNNDTVISSSSVGGFGVANGSTQNQLLLTGNLPATTLTVEVQYTYDGKTVTDSGQISVILP